PPAPPIHTSPPSHQAPGRSRLMAHSYPPSPRTAPSTSSPPRPLPHIPVPPTHPSCSKSTPPRARGPSPPANPSAWCTHPGPCARASPCPPITRILAGDPQDGDQRNGVVPKAASSTRS
ncbi:hypothetical protein FA95DRAFT_1502232, partial [Auriscalpium vulgare]